MSSKGFDYENPIQTIFLCEFHPHRGPIISCQYPENSISKDLFDSISVYLIPKPQLYKRIITVRVSGLKIASYPNEIQSTFYDRNQFLFNLCFACNSNDHTVQYESVVKKLSKYFENLEIENRFLSNERSKEGLPGIFQKILEELNKFKQSKVEIPISYINERALGRSENKKSDIEAKRSYSGYSSHERRSSIVVTDRKKDSISLKIGPKFSQEESSSISEIIKKETETNYVSVIHLKVIKK